jgi:hypothetical protein
MLPARFWGCEGFETPTGWVFQSHRSKALCDGSSVSVLAGNAHEKGVFAHWWLETPMKRQFSHTDGGKCPWNKPIRESRVQYFHGAFEAKIVTFRKRKQSEAGKFGVAICARVLQAALRAP